MKLIDNLKKVLFIESKEDVRLLVSIFSFVAIAIYMLWLAVSSFDKGIPSGYEIIINNGIYKVDNYVIIDNQVVFTVEVEGQQREYKVSKDIVEIKPVR